jgi:hypothetical protein
MLNVTDVTNLLNVHGTPVTAAQIADLRHKQARSNPLGEESVSGQIMRYTPPILGLDIVASLAVAAVEASLPDPVGDMLKDDHYATKTDWGDGIAGAYVNKVRSSGRPLIAAETAMLASHRSLESHVKTAMTTIKNAIFS